MPSWNIHTAHVEKLLSSGTLEVFGIQDKNSFLFGNFVPDIYAGHMVKPITHKIKYNITHLAEPLFIPCPNAKRFYKTYLVKNPTDDLVLGAWAHLLCDHYYNLRTNEYIARIGVKPGEQMRIRKQADFDMFGRTLCISSVPQATDELIAQCASFPQYPIEKSDVLATIRVQRDIVRKNADEHIEGIPTYSLLTPEFFSQTFAEVDAVLKEALRMHAAGEDPTCFGCDDYVGEDGSDQGKA